MAGLWRVRALRDGLEIEAGNSKSGIGTPSSGYWFKERVFESSGIEAKGEELMVLSGWGSSSILILATRVMGKLILPVNCRVATTPNYLLDLPLEIKLREGYELVVEDRLWPLCCRHSCIFSQATLSSLVVMVATSGAGGGGAIFYAWSPPITPRTNVSSYKERDCSGLGGPPPT